MVGRGSDASHDKRDVDVRRLMPSEFMRNLHPEYYSDTCDAAAYALDQPTFEYQLDSITSRNQTQDFELFCRKLCERVVCPNLRPQTGPEGGGDSKADSETYPVSDENASVFIGEPNAGRERWAFAFSAKKTWKQKIRDDVAGIVGTGRRYDRIICVTSRPARAKDRAELEDALSAEHGVPVTIFDRNWIVKEIIDADRKDLAFNYLNVGSARSDPLALGPDDYSRTRQLANIEKSFDDPSTYDGMKIQKVSEALVAAKLSRNLERPRTETDGRFLRAIRFANKDGTEHQKLLCRYEHAWTAFWWFDDIDFLLEMYDAFAADGLRSEHAADIGLVCNLYQLLVNCVVHEHLSREGASLDRRRDDLRATLEPIAADLRLPNNALEAESLLLNLRLSAAVIEKDPSLLPSIWKAFGQVIQKAEGLGEFDAARLERIIEVAGPIAGNDPAYTELIEQLADFVARRRSEGEGAIVLLKRAKKLDFDHRMDMIRLLGKAAIRLAKREYKSYLVEATQLLALAYRSADLYWAARSSILSALATICIQAEEDHNIPVSIVPTLKVWGWISCSLGHLPDFFSAVQLLNGALSTLPLTDESKVLVREDLEQLDLALGSFILNLDASELDRLVDLPDSLEGLGLFSARSALLYINGHLRVLREDGSVPPSETDEGVHDLMSTLASQPVRSEVGRHLVLNSQAAEVFGTTVLGMRLTLTHDGSDEAILIAEILLAALEAFFGTALDHRITAHTELIRMDLRIAPEATEPLVINDKLDMQVTLTWPASFVVSDFIRQGDLHKFLMTAFGQILGLGFVAADIEKTIEELFKNDAVQQRIGMILTTTNSYHRLNKRNLSRLGEWRMVDHRSYPPVLPRPALAIKEVSQQVEAEDEADAQPRPSFPPRVTAHRGIQVQSIVDVHAWDQAKWSGIGYEGFRPPYPPIMTFLFEDRVAAVKIFERWRERVGNKDKNDEIHISIVRNLPNQSPHHYIAMVCAKPPSVESKGSQMVFSYATRSMTMTPESDTNLRWFLAEYEKYRCFVIAPAIIKSVGTPETLHEFGILKRNIVVKSAADVGSHDIEMTALRIRRPIPEP